jgi:site-specific DNA recombinase
MGGDRRSSALQKGKNQMKPALRAYGYVRVSVDEEGGQNASISAQGAAIRAHAEREGIELVTIFEELNVSGRKLQRKQFDRMMTQATAPDRPVHMIIVYALSRFARRLLTQVVSEHRLAEAGVSLLSLTENFGNDSNGKMGRAMVAVMNEKYVHDASVFTTRDRRGNAISGHWNGGPIPLGYESRVVSVFDRKERKKLFIREDEARIVRLIFDLALQGLHGRPMGTRAIAAYLNDNGYSLRGRRFHNSNVDGILTRQHYAGAYLHRPTNAQALPAGGGDPVIVSCPQIIEPDLMAQVAATRAKSAPRVRAPRITNSPVLLGGVATCGHSGCGAGLVIRSGKAGAYRYYTCNAKATAGAERCKSKPIREEALDQIVLDGLLKRVLAPARLRILLADVLDRSDEAEERRRKDHDRVRRERIAAEGRLSRLLDLVAEEIMSPREPVFAAKLAEARASIAALSETERSLAKQIGRKAGRIDDAAVKRFGERLRAEITGANTELRRAYLRIFVSGVVVNDNEILVAGSRAALEAGAHKGETGSLTSVPSFDREWCPEADSNLHGLATAST